MSDPPEALVIIRGGGSQDDLAAFSTEQVVRSVAASRIPTIVGVGHESDISLAELAADRRASTPSNAAELLVPNIEDERSRLASLSKSLNAKLDALYGHKVQDTSFKREKLDQILNSIFVQLQGKLEQDKLIFKALNPEAPLSKGFAMVKTRTGQFIKTADAAKSYNKLTISFQDGSVNVLRDDNEEG